MKLLSSAYRMDSILRNLCLNFTNECQVWQDWKRNINDYLRIAVGLKTASKLVIDRLRNPVTINITLYYIRLYLSCHGLLDNFWLADGDCKVKSAAFP